MLHQQQVRNNHAASMQLLSTFGTFAQQSRLEIGGGRIDSLGLQSSRPPEAHEKEHILGLVANLHKPQNMKLLKAIS